MRRSIPVLMALGLLLASCVPAPEPEVSGTAPRDQASCVAVGGDWRREGMLGNYMCVQSFADAGKRCTDGDQCLGDCRVTEGEFPAPDTAAVGQCQANTSPFGCFSRVEDGKAQVGLCVD